MIVFHLLTESRFEGSREEVLSYISANKKNEDFDTERANQVLEEDDRLEIKYKTFRKCRLRILIALPIASVTLLLWNQSSLFLLLATVSVFVSISSFFGLLTNRITPQQKKYLNGH